MKGIKLSIVLIITIIILGGCTSTSGVQYASTGRHPVIKDRVDMMSTEIRISIFVADNIDTPRLGNYNLRRGNNYLRVPVGNHILYWSKKGESYRKQIKINDENKRFGIF